MRDSAAAEAPADSEASPEWRDIHVTAQDGLRLHLREYGDRTHPHLPVVCLPGLTRNVRDFHNLAVFLSTDEKRPRRVVAMDFRGRGGSAYDPDWKNYNPLTETSDVLDVLTARGIEEAAFVGTSRGGLVTMLLAAARPTALRAVVLNDIGPVVDGRGLLRIKNVLSRGTVPASWDDAAETLKQAYEGHFPNVDRTGWMEFAYRTYADGAGKPKQDFDSKLLKTLSAIDFDQPMPTMWPQFDGLASVPVMVVHGENSDILSKETVAEMRDRHPALEVLSLPDTGHAPFLTESASMSRLADFISAAEGKR